MKKGKTIVFQPAEWPQPVTGTIVEVYPKGRGREMIVVEWQGTTLWGKPSQHTVRECLHVINGQIMP